MDEHIYNRHDFEAKALPIKYVTVYGECAEVKRLADFNAVEGQNSIFIKNISSMIKPQSIKVEGMSDGVITNVNYVEQTSDINTTDNQKIKLLVTEKETKDNEYNAIHGELEVLKKSQELLDGMASQIGNTSSSPKKKLRSVPMTQALKDSNIRKDESNVENDTPTDQLSRSVDLVLLVSNDDVIKKMRDFLEYYNAEANRYKREIAKKEKEMCRLFDELKDLDKEIDQIRSENEYDCINRLIRIDISVQKSMNLRFFLIYQVHCASWKPFYNIRATTSTIDSTLSNSITVDYYGVIEQRTDEDWINANIILSTANPSIGGSVPALHGITANLVKYICREKNGSFHRTKKYISDITNSDEDLGFGSFDYNELTDAAGLQRQSMMNQAFGDDANCYIQGPDQVPCEHYAIEKPVSIYNNVEKNKVKITSIEMSPYYQHECHPSKSTSAFLTASILNDSKLTLLKGHAAIYFNNSFIGNTFIGDVMPGEAFYCTLGTDPSIKIEHKLPKKKMDTIGILTKSSLYTHEQSVVIRNAKPSQPINITIRENIPKSTEEKLKISLLSPDLKHLKDEAKVTNDSVMEWNCTIQPGEHRELVIKWTAEYPLHEAIQYNFSSNSSPSSSIIWCSLKSS
uniref:DUF4139 domain-containing protein n=1 Tax=Rhabditophanes sp. KR3021 TaxID=114890 RepID=A0AC35U6V5_9BILA